MVIPAGGHLPYVAADWADTLLVVAGGEVDLCCLRAGCRRFGPGSVLFLTGLGLVTLRNPGVDRTVLIACTRS
jgi:hypothetical protein